MKLLKRYTDWMHSWTHIVPGNFSDSGFSDLLLYDQNAGIAGFFASNGAGEMQLLGSYTDWSQSWAHIVPLSFSGGRFTDLLLYDQVAGVAAFITTDGAGGFAIIRTYDDWRNSWDLIVPGHFSGDAYPNEWDSRIDRPRKLSDLLLYDRIAGHGSFVTINNDGSFSILREHINWRQSWSHIASAFFCHDGESGFSDLLFYEQSTGQAAFYSTDGQGNIALASESSWLTSHDVILTGRFGGGTYPDLLLYDRSDGKGSFHFAPKGQLTPIIEYSDWRKDWAKIVAGRFSDSGFTDLLFYDASAGEAEFYQFEPPNPWPLRPIEGYTSAPGVTAGESIGFHISLDTPGAFAISIYRVGVTDVEIMTAEGVANRHPIPPDAYEAGCDWPVAHTLNVPISWKSGLYLARLSQGSATTEIFFVVKASQHDRARILFAFALTTHQAYGWWGEGAFTDTGRVATCCTGFLAPFAYPFIAHSLQVGVTRFRLSRFHLSGG